MSWEMFAFIVSAFVTVSFGAFAYLYSNKKRSDVNYDDPSGNDNIKRRFWDYM